MYSETAHHGNVNSEPRLVSIFTNVLKNFAPKNHKPAEAPVEMDTAIRTDAGLRPASPDFSIRDGTGMPRDQSLWLLHT